MLPPVVDTAANKASEGDHAILTQLLFAALVRVVHVSPSGLVITRVPVPEYETAANRLSDGDHSTADQLLSDALVLEVQTTPIFGLSNTAAGVTRLAATIPGIIAATPSTVAWRQARPR